MSAGICCNNTSDVPVQVLVRQKYWPHSADRDLPAAGDTMQRRVCVYCSAEFVCPASFRGKNPKCSGCRATGLNPNNEEEASFIVSENSTA